MISSKISLSKNAKYYMNFIRSISNESILEDLKAKFAHVNAPNYYDELVRKHKDLPSLKRASVLVPISVQEVLDKNGHSSLKTFFTLTKRPDTMNTHKGEVCFVGGKRDDSDLDDVFTAYREAKEEINLEKNDVVLLAQMCPLITFNQMLVTPVVVYFDKKNFKPIKNEKEVELIFDLPTERFLTKENHKMKCIKNDSGEYYIHYFKDIIENRKIVTWGFTSFLSVMVSMIANSKAPAFHLIPHKKLDKSNINDYLETYLFTKLAFSQTHFRNRKE
jgi:8-oxo-dGTP pyrophosphatase MutT (NUDIX family)